MKLLYKKENLHILAYGEGHVKQFTLSPGINEVSDTHMDELLKNPSVKKMIEDGAMEILEEKKDLPKQSKKKEEK